MENKAPTIETTIRGAGFFGPPGIRAHGLLLPGDPLIATREPDNPVDSNAIVVATTDDICIGYVARENAAILAPWMDRGGSTRPSVLGPPRSRVVADFDT